MTRGGVLCRALISVAALVAAGALAVAGPVVSTSDDGRPDAVTQSEAMAVPQVTTGAVDTAGDAQADAQSLMAAPARVLIPALGVSAPIDSVLEVPDGSGGRRMEVPDDISRVGWDRMTAPSGAPHGVTLLVGHRDSSAGGHGALEHIEDLAPGDEVLVDAARGNGITYTVTGVDIVLKDALPARALHSAEGLHRLALVTCGGALVLGLDGLRHWNSNVIVWASPRSRSVSPPSMRAPQGQDHTGPRPGGGPA